MNVNWDSEVDTNEAGEFTFVGTLEMLEGYVNTKDVVVEATITVVTEEEAAVRKAEETNNIDDWETAIDLVWELDESDIKEDLDLRLDEVITIIDAYEFLEKAENDRTLDNVNTAWHEILYLNDGELKTELLDRLSKLGFEMNQLALKTIQEYVEYNDASQLTIEELEVAGVTSIETDNLDEYKLAVAEAETIADLQTLQTLVEGVNTAVEG